MLQLQKQPVKAFFESEGVKAKFNELLGKNATSFITSVLQIVNSNELLKEANPTTIYTAAAMAATLNLPINNQLGFAYIVPYKSRDRGVEAQFQLGYKGLIQLALRSGQFKSLNATPIYDGQLVEQNPLTGYVFDFPAKKSDVVIGYAAYMKLINGFEKTHYMTKKEVEAHSFKYSQTAKKGFGVWKDDFDAMALKTVTKLMLAKYAPLSVDINKAVVTDQAVINDAETLDVSYVDQTPETPDKEEERVKAMIEMCGTNIDELDKLADQVGDSSPDYLYLVEAKITELNERK